MNGLLTLTFIVANATDTIDVSWWWILPVLALEGFLDGIISNRRKKF
jgi:hypothetical protein